jgi:hypothetical protein
MKYRDLKFINISFYAMLLFCMPAFSGNSFPLQEERFFAEFSAKPEVKPEDFRNGIPHSVYFEAKNIEKTRYLYQSVAINKIKKEKCFPVDKDTLDGFIGSYPDQGNYEKIVSLWIEMKFDNRIRDVSLISYEEDLEATHTLHRIYYKEIRFVDNCDLISFKVFGPDEAWVYTGFFQLISTFQLK